MKLMNKIPVEQLFELFDVDFDHGLLFHKVAKSTIVKAGDVVGGKDKHGHLVTSIKNQKFFVHRIIWAMKYGAWPQNQIDHINGDKSDNRIANLREATNAQNSANNKVPQKNNKTGFRGVFFDKNRQKFRATIKKDGKTRELGRFNTPEEAHAAYIAASQQFHGEYSPFCNQRGD